MLSLTGIPPLAGFMGKYYLFSTAMEKGFTGLVIIALAGSAISAGYYFKPVIAMYLKEGDGIRIETGVLYRVHLVFLALLTVLLGILPFLVSGILRAS
jgi:NADH-quinone oxidoreductase subunit N